MRFGPVLFITSFFIGISQGQSLSNRVLVVHNTAYAESVQVADYYVTSRAIPAGNRCAINSTVITTVTWADYDAKVRQPIRACLNAIGRNNILYIVFSYQTPYRVTTTALTYSVDQYVADIWDAYSVWNSNPWPTTIQPYYAEAQTEGGYYLPFVSLADYRAQPMAMPIYSVWRLDAPSAAIAKGLVDKAKLAETNGLSGQACFDQRGAATYDNIAGSAEWDLSRASSIARRAGLTVTQDLQAPEFGTAPAPLRCDNAALYAGWYTYNSYNDAFTWNTGAIGFHLDSASAGDPRGGANWSANALLRGITITSGAVSEPYVDGLAHPDVVFRSLLQGANAGDAMLRGTQWLKWMVINMGDPLYRPFPGGRAPFNQPFGESALRLSPRAVSGPATVSGIVQLPSPAPVSGTVVTLSTDRPTVATVPPSVTVAAGQTTANFVVTFSAVTSNTNVKVKANTTDELLTNSVVVVPLLGSLNFTPYTTSGGQSVSGVLQLLGPAPLGGVTVQLESANPALVSVPATVYIPTGLNAAMVTATTFPATVNTRVVITLRCGGAVVTSAVTVLPAISSLSLTPAAGAIGASRVLKVSFASPAPAGATVSLTSTNPNVVPVPASVSATVGATSVSVTLAGGTASGSSTITASYKGDTSSVVATTTGSTVSSLSVSSAVAGGNSGTGTVTLSGAPASNTVVTLASNNPAAVVPASVTVAAGSTTATFSFATSPVVDPVTVTLTATSGGVSKTDTVVVNPPALSSVSLAPTSVTGGSTGTGTITLSGVAPTGGSLVTLSTSNAAAHVPASITVPAGAKTATFSYSTSPVASSTPLTVAGVFRGLTKSGTLTVMPPAPTSLTVSSGVVAGGSNVIGTILLNAVAPAGGIVITVSSDKSEASVPATVTIPAGVSSTTFPITTSAVAGNKNVTISATFLTKTERAAFKLTP